MRNPKVLSFFFTDMAEKKSSMIDKADVFLDLGYNVFMVDFIGSGGSEGLQTTIGYKEAENVKVHMIT